MSKPLLDHLHDEPGKASSVLSESDRGALTRRLFDRLSRTSDETVRQGLREQITAVNMCVAESIAHRYHGRGERTEDLVQVAYLGLSKAVSRFEPGLDKDFLTYAVPTISGELKKYFRDCCWTVRPPRRIQELQWRIGPCVETLAQRLDRPPRPAEIAAELAVDASDIVEALSADGCFTPSSLDAPVGKSGTTALGDVLSEPDTDFTLTEIHLLLAPLVRELADRDRDIVALRFYHDWTQEKIANEFGITQMQVSRLLSRIMRRLRDRIE